MTTYELRDELDKKGLLHEYRTAVTRDFFEAHWTKTKESIRFTFHGWDGKSYNGESRTAKVYTCNIPGTEGERFVKVGKALHMIDEESSIMEKATGEYHKGVYWCVDVLWRQ